MLEINGRTLVEQKKDVSSQQLAANLWGRICKNPEPRLATGSKKSSSA
jgi:hypothetical protein